MALWRVGNNAYAATTLVNEFNSCGGTVNTAGHGGHLGGAISIQLQTAVTLSAGETLLIAVAELEAGTADAQPGVVAAAGLAATTSRVTPAAAGAATMAGHQPGMAVTVTVTTGLGVVTAAGWFATHRLASLAGVGAVTVTGRPATASVVHDAQRLRPVLLAKLAQAGRTTVELAANATTECTNPHAGATDAAANNSMSTAIIGSNRSTVDL